MFKKFLITIVSIAASVAVLIDGYLMFFKHDQSQETAQSQATAASDTESESSTTTSSSSTSSSNSTMKDGTYTGKSTSTEWGDVQVKITVASGKITQITVLKHPTGGKSDESQLLVLTDLQARSPGRPKRQHQPSFRGNRNLQGLHWFSAKRH